MTGWGKEWPVGDRSALLGLDSDPKSWPNPTKMDNGSTITWTGVDLAKPNSDKTIISKDGWPIVSEQIKTYPKNITNTKELKSQGSNLVDAEAYLYFQCESCQIILDPHTRSFAELQQNRVDAGWKCVWNTNGLGYNVYCHKCGEGK